MIRIGSTNNSAGTVYQIERFVAHPYWGAGRESYGDICVDAPGGTSTICNGDSGSPLLVKVQGFWQLAGVASRLPGETGCLTGPPVYTSTDFAWHWIQIITMDDH